MMLRVSRSDRRLPSPFQPVLTSRSFRTGFRHLRRQYAGVLGRVKQQERRAVAGGEGRRRLGNAALGARQLRGEARQEMVLHLLGGQTGDRRQDAKRVSGKENDLRRMARDTGLTILSICDSG